MNKDKDKDFNTITKQTPRELNIDIFNKLICDDNDFELSQRNLIMMYSYLYLFIQQNLTDNLDTFLNTTSYFNKIIFLKYLNFFRKLNDLQKRFEAEKAILEAENKKIDDFKKHFISNTIMLLTNQNYIDSSDLVTLLTTDTLEGIYNIIETLFDTNIIDNIYNNVITNITNDENSFQEYKTLFHLNPINNNSVSSEKAIFFIGFHGSLFTVVPNNTYLTIKTPIDTTINRWGTRGEPTRFFNSMKYTFKQCLLMQDEEKLDIDTANACFELLGTSKQPFNYDERQTTPAYCVKEPDNYFSDLTGFDKNELMRIKHYSTDSYNFMIFNTDYTIPPTLFTNLSSKIPQLNNLQYNTAENIINLNFLLFTNNIEFNVFNVLNIHNQTSFDKSQLYPYIGLYTKYYIDQYKKPLQSHLHNFYFPLDIVSFKEGLFIEDFVLERDIFALNTINIRLTYQDIDRSFVLFKGDSFSSNPYIIEYFIRKFNSKITIRPGPILGTKEDENFTQNKDEGTTNKQGSTITCLSKGLSCYKVTLSVLTNYEILQFCKDANIRTCDLYDTSCQSFMYVDDRGKIINYTPPEQQKQTLKRMNTNNDSTMLSTYDNLSDILFGSLIKTPNFQVVGVEVEEKRKKTGGKTKKRKNSKKNTYKQRKNSKKNTYKQKRYTNRITL